MAWGLWPRLSRSDPLRAGTARGPVHLLRPRALPCRVARAPNAGPDADLGFRGFGQGAALRSFCLLPSTFSGPQDGVGIMATPLSLRPAARRDGARSGPPAEATGASVSCSEGAECGTGCGLRISGLRISDFLRISGLRISGLRAGGGASFLLPSTFYLLPSTLAHASLSVMVRLKTRRPGALSSSSAK